MNTTLAHAAIKAVTAPGFEKGDGYCQKWLRQTIQAWVGSKYNAYHKASAKLSAEAWLKSPYGQRYTGQQIPLGALLYKTVGSGGFGHCGIYVGNNRVAENSSFHGKKDARGFRTLQQFGTFQVLVCLPDPKPQPKPAPSTPTVPRPPEIVLGYYDGNEIKAVRFTAEVRDGNSVVTAHIREIAAAWGVDTNHIEWGDGTPALIRKD